MSRPGIALAVLACVLLAAAGVRLAAAADKQVLTHDESISYLAAACHQGDYTRLTVAGEPPYGGWARAADWKDLLRPDRPLCLAQIGRDLAREDIHPPLYFWLLHAWALVFGVGLWTGVALNVVLGAVTGVALFGLARRVLGDPLKAVGVTAVWSFSPAVVRVFAEARQYELLALLAVLFVWQCLRFCDPPTTARRRDAALLAVAAAAGALAHFLFALVAVAGAGLLVARLWRGQRALLAWGIASIAAGYATFSLLHPGFQLSLERAGAQGSAATLDRFLARVDRTLDTLAEFLLPPALARGALGYVACAALVAAVAFVLARASPAAGRSHGSRAGGASARSRFRTASMPLVFAWLASAHIMLYLSFASPGGAMSFKHLSAVWPFAAFVPLLALEALPRRARAPVAASGGAALVVAGVVTVFAHFPPPAPVAPLAGARGVVVDNVARGVLPRVVWRLPDDARVLAADQRYLLEHSPEWLADLERGDVYVGGLPASDPRYGNSPDRGRRVAAAIARRHRLEALPDPLDRARILRVGSLLRPTGGPQPGERAPRA